MLFSNYLPVGLLFTNLVRWLRKIVYMNSMETSREEAIEEGKNLFKNEEIITKPVTQSESNQNTSLLPGLHQSREEPTELVGQDVISLLFFLASDADFIKELIDWWEPDKQNYLTPIQKVFAYMCLKYYKDYGGQALNRHAEGVCNKFVDNYFDKEPQRAEEFWKLFDSIAAMELEQLSNRQYILDLVTKNYKINLQREQSIKIGKVVDIGKFDEARELIDKLELKLRREKENSYRMVDFEEIKMLQKPISWLWYNKFPLGFVSMIAGPKTGGKTVVAEYIATITSLSEPNVMWPDNTRREVVDGKILIINLEENIHQVQINRLEQLGANMKNFKWLKRSDYGREIKDRKKEYKPFTISELQKYEEAIVRYKPTLIILDHLTLYLDKHGNYQGDLTQQVAYLNEIAEEIDGAILVLTHTRKGKEGDPLEHILGKIELIMSIKGGMFQVRQDKDDDDVTYLIPMPSNLVVKSTGIKFTRSGLFGRGDYKMEAEESNLTLEQVIGFDDLDKEQNATMLEVCMEFIEGRLIGIPGNSLDGKTLRQEWLQGGKGRNEGRFWAALKRLIKQGRIEKGESSGYGQDYNPIYSLVK